MTCNFTSFSTVIQFHQASGMVILKDYVQWNPIYARKYFRLQREAESGLLDQRAVLKPTNHP